MNLSRFDRIGWMTAARDLGDISEYLFLIPHCPLIPPGVARRRTYADPRLFAAGMVGHVPEGPVSRLSMRARATHA